MYVTISVSGGHKDKEWILNIEHQSVPRHSLSTHFLRTTLHNINNSSRRPSPCLSSSQPSLSLVWVGVIFSIYCPLLLLSHNTARVGLINQYGGGLVGQIRKWFYCWGKSAFDQSQGWDALTDRDKPNNTKIKKSLWNNLHFGTSLKKSICIQQYDKA